MSAGVERVRLPVYQEQREFGWNSVANRPDSSEMTQEIAYGHLTMQTSSPRRHQLSVFARLYRTSAGNMLVLWPDKLHVPPMCCVTLKDTFVTTDEAQSSITLRGQNDDDLPLTLVCPRPEDYQLWKKAFGNLPPLQFHSIGSGKRKQFITSVVRRLPMLIEEEIWEPSTEDGTQSMSISTDLKTVSTIFTNLYRLSYTRRVIVSSSYCLYRCTIRSARCILSFQRFQYISWVIWIAIEQTQFFLHYMPKSVVWIGCLFMRASESKRF